MSVLVVVLALGFTKLQASGGFLAVYSGFSGRQRIGKVDQVNDPASVWVRQEPHWGLIETLLGGTYSMRKNHRRFLPQEPRETDESYQNRLNRSVLCSVLHQARTHVGRHVDAQACAS